MKRITFIGPVSPPVSGPGIKNSFLLNSLIDKHGNIKVVNTIGWKKKIFKLLKELFRDRNDRVVLSISRRGRFIFLPCLFLVKKIRKNFKYILIPAGGGTYQEVNKLNIFFKKLIILALKNCDYIYVESHQLKKDLTTKFGLNNVKYLPNFKTVKLETPSNFKKTNKDPIRLVYLSRVRKLKGVEISLEAIAKISGETSKNITYDIYGPIEIGYEETFLNKLQDYPFASYKGPVEISKVAEVLSHYDAFVFPTYHPDEGFPGVIIDAFMAGLPVIATSNNSNGEIVKNNINGYLVEPQNVNDLADGILKIVEHAEIRGKMRENNYKEAEKYDVDTLIEKLLSELRLKQW